MELYKMLRIVLQAYVPESSRPIIDALEAQGMKLDKDYFVWSYPTMGYIRFLHEGVVHQVTFEHYKTIVHRSWHIPHVGRVQDSFVYDKGVFTRLMTLEGQKIGAHNLEEIQAEVTNILNTLKSEGRWS